MIVAAAGLTSDVHGLRNVLGEVGDELDGVGTFRLGGVETAELGLLDAPLERLRLIGDGGNDTAIRRAVAVEVEVAEGGRIVSSVDPVPGVGVSSLRLAAMSVGPGGDAAQAAPRFRFEDLANDLLGLWREELLCSVSNLLVNYDKM